ncbi:MAG: patatin-like phospholipase family protein [Bacteroidota bacterium]
MSDKQNIRLLSIDGGGIRGIIPAYLLKFAEEYLEKKVPGTTLADHFDLIAGTSTGGMLSVIYLTPQDEDRSKAKYSAADALDFYLQEGYHIFNASKRSSFKRLWGLSDATIFNPGYLEQLLLRKFGDLQMSDLIKPCLVTTYNMQTQSSFFFTNTDDPNRRAFYLRDVLRSTSAAPTYFPPAKIQNVAPGKTPDDPSEMINLDGGVFANNPTMCMYAEARKSKFENRSNHYPGAQHMCILSLGTGGGGFEISRKETSHKWNLLKWAGLLPEIMIDGSVDTVAFQMNEIWKTLNEDDMGGYLRIDTPVKDRGYAADMADASEENIEKLLLSAEKTLTYAKEKGLCDFLDKMIDT